MCYAEKVWAEEARAEGMKLGVEKGMEKDIRNMFSPCQRMKMETSQILQELHSFYGLASEEASACLGM